jgi:hypothetical protein
MDAAPLPEQQKSAAAPMSSMDVTVPAPIATQVANIALRETDNQVKRHEGAARDTHRLVFLRGETVPSLDILTGGSFITEYRAITPRQGLRC